MKKIYLNITNHCNVSCPFCCMFSSPDKTRFLSFDKLYQIVKDNKDSDIIVQFEGGEPLTHPDFILFLEYVASLNNVKEIVIDTNAFLLDKFIDKIVDISDRKQKTIIVKPSYNRYLADLYNKTHMVKFPEYVRNLITSCEFLDYVKFKVNVRGFSQEELTELEEELGDILRPYIVSFLFNSYGRLKENNTVPELKINKVFEDWECYNSEGISYKQDLIARSESEK